MEPDLFHSVNDQKQFDMESRCGSVTTVLRGNDDDGGDGHVQFSPSSDDAVLLRSIMSQTDSVLPLEDGEVHNL